MGVRVIVGKDDGGEGQDVAVFYDSVVGWAFGPVFGGIVDHDELGDGKDEAEAFLLYLNERYGRGWRSWTDGRLEAEYGTWPPEVIEEATGHGRR